MAITKYDQFDFLIDIVPREELKPVKRQVKIPYSKFKKDLIIFNKEVYLIIL